MKYVKSQKERRQNNMNDVVLEPLLLISYIFCNLFYCFEHVMPTGIVKVFFIVVKENY